jgi:hypothetical protein
MDNRELEQLLRHATLKQRRVTKYSGPASKKFWARIWALKEWNEQTFALAYIAGCALQDHEHRMFQLLEEAESWRPKPDSEELAPTTRETRP